MNIKNENKRLNRKWRCIVWRGTMFQWQKLCKLRDGIEKLAVVLELRVVFSNTELIK